MTPTLDSLSLTEEERAAAREEIQRRAYRKWEEAGRPSGNDLRFWQDAEREWIAYCYVPDRELAVSEHG